MKKEDDKRNMEEMHQQKVKQMVKSAEETAGPLQKRSRSPQHGEEEQILEKEKKRTQGYWIVVKQRGNNGQGIGNVTNVCRNWRTGLGKMKN